MTEQQQSVQKGLIGIIGGPARSRTRASQPKRRASARGTQNWDDQLREALSFICGQVTAPTGRADHRALSGRTRRREDEAGHDRPYRRMPRFTTRWARRSGMRPSTTASGNTRGAKPTPT